MSRDPSILSAQDCFYWYIRGTDESQKIVSCLDARYRTDPAIMGATRSDGLEIPDPLEFLEDHLRTGKECRDGDPQERRRWDIDGLAHQRASEPRQTDKK